MKPLITCIVPVFNGETYLAEALDSIMAQQHRPLEVLVVDDGSVDGTAAVVERYALEHKEVRLISQENAGSPAARNRALAQATGDFICFLDSDDLWDREKLETQLRAFAGRPELGYCVHHVQNFWVEELAEEEAKLRDHRRSQPIPGYVTTTMMVRRRTFDEVGHFDPDLSHGDSMDWFLRARELGIVGELLPDVLLRRRMHPKNTSRTQGTNSLDEFFHLLKRSIDRGRVAESAA